MGLTPCMPTHGPPCAPPTLTPCPCPCPPHPEHEAEASRVVQRYRELEVALAAGREELAASTLRASTLQGELERSRQQVRGGGGAMS